MKLIFTNVSMENFQCHKQETFDLYSKYNEFRGFNGVGKTTVLNAIVWCLSGADYSGNKKPQISPVIDGEYMQDVQTVVELTMQHEYELGTAEIKIKRTAKKGVNSIYINDIKMKKSEYIDYMQEKIGIDLDELMLLSNPNYVANMNWQDSRNLIMGMVGDITNDDVVKANSKFEPILQKVNDFGIEPLLSSVHSANLDIQNNIIPSLNGKIELLSKANDEVELTLKNLPKLESEKADLIVRLNNYDKRMADEIEKSNAATKTRDEINEYTDIYNNYKSQLNDIVIEGKQIASDLSNESDVMKYKNQQINNCELEIMNKKSEISEVRQDVENSKKVIVNVKKAFEETKAENVRVENDKCPFCHQNLPKNKIDEMLVEAKHKHNEKLKSLKAEYESGIKDFKANEKLLGELELHLKELEEKLEGIKITDYSVTINDNENVSKLKARRESLLEKHQEISIKIKQAAQDVNELKKKLDNLPKPQKIDSPIAERERLEIINRKMIEIESQKKKHEEIIEIQEQLKNKKLELAKGKKVEDMIIEFKKVKAEMVADSLKKYFEITSFITSETLRNGEEKETFKLLMDDKPFNMLSTGEKIRVGLDLLNGIQKLKGITLPIMIDSSGELSEIPEYMVDEKQFICCKTISMPKETAATTDDEKKRNQKFINTYSKLQFLGY